MDKQRIIDLLKNGYTIFIEQKQFLPSIAFLVKEGKQQEIPTEIFNEMCQEEILAIGFGDNGPFVKIKESSKDSLAMKI